MKTGHWKKGYGGGGGEKSASWEVQERLEEGGPNSKGGSKHGKTEFILRNWEGGMRLDVRPASWTLGQHQASIKMEGDTTAQWCAKDMPAFAIVGPQLNQSPLNVTVELSHGQRKQAAGHTGMWLPNQNTSTGHTWSNPHYASAPGAFIRDNRVDTILVSRQTNHDYSRHMMCPLRPGNGAGGIFPCMW